MLSSDRIGLVCWKADVIALRKSVGFVHKFLYYLNDKGNANRSNSFHLEFAGYYSTLGPTKEKLSMEIDVATKNTTIARIMEAAAAALLVRED